MAPSKMPLRVDEELGKKDDDHQFSEQRQTRFRLLSNSRIPRPRRLLLAVLALFLLYQFFKHMPDDLAPAVERYNPTIASLKHPKPPSPSGSVQSLPIPKAQILPNDKAGALYDGKVKFYELAQSLPREKHPGNMASHAVMFAASSLHSVSDMLPMACGMAAKGLNHVHFVLMGKEEVSIDGIKQVNAISDLECPMTWHDSRPDRAGESTDARMERSVGGGLEVLRMHIAPEVVITQRQDWETPFFWNGVQAHSLASGIPHIALPASSINLMWMVHIDSTALQAWNEIHVEMVVHASESSSSLIRLIRSLDAADYLGTKPSLTVELPAWVDPELLASLQDLNGLSQLAGRITLRRRIQPHYMDPAESSLRTVESFYPLNPKVSHMLLLSPQTELAPSFYHYLKYSILFYKQSSRAQRVASKLLGISLELPSVKPTSDTEPLTPTSLEPPAQTQGGGQYIPSFLWQAPNSNAALYFGDKWSEFHSFLSSRLASSERDSHIPSHEKLISLKYPAFMEYLLEMMRAKGYYLLYPSFPGRTAASLATVHTDLYHPPEEFTHTPSGTNSEDQSGTEIKHPIPPATTAIRGLSAEKPLDRASTILPLLDAFELGLSDVESIPLLSYNGERLAEETLQKQTMDYARIFRVRYGHCSEESQQVDDPSAPLFCLEE
ncbi:uncharacterized protein N7482_006974 [Penicillium canariense]|uniref:Glycosyltransferase 2 n=1 Tax=Penicillium canariense TaxID=189055 RepID=A0A9W9I0R4_9EURO|nr:uncharacterized protein N7482_006974 [Penicillium canariense]KAJ5159970.1 hypothetical protein N7482_006974 [Penicillium canariense]